MPFSLHANKLGNAGVAELVTGLAGSRSLVAVTYASACFGRVWGDGNCSRTRAHNDREGVDRWRALAPLPRDTNNTAFPRTASRPRAARRWRRTSRARAIYVCSGPGCANAAHTRFGVLTPPPAGLAPTGRARAAAATASRATTWARTASQRLHAGYVVRASSKSCRTAPHCRATHRRAGMATRIAAPLTARLGLEAGSAHTRSGCVATRLREVGMGAEGVKALAGALRNISLRELQCVLRPRKRAPAPAPC